MVTFKNKNKDRMKFNLVISSIVLALSFGSCVNEHSSSEKGEQQSQLELQKNKGYKLVYAMSQKVGDYSKLLEKKDVVYTYTYETPDNKVNISTEKYIFKNELSYGVYKKHERTFPQLEGVIEQSYDGNEYWLKNKGVIIDNEVLLKKVVFSRHTNFYWFTMLQKLLDPGVNYEYIDEKKFNGVDYDVVKVTFESKDSKPKDIYQLYINQRTKLVDQFLFTVADFGKMEPRLMKVEYEEIDGFLMPTKRKYKLSDWNATETSEPWATANWTDIKFNNNLSITDFKK